MRPEILYPLFSTVDTLKGVGPKRVPLFERLCGARILDVLMHLPTGVIDRRADPGIRGLNDQQIVTLKVEVVEYRPAMKRGQPWRIAVSDGTGFMDLVYFQGHADWFQKILPIGGRVVVSGKAEIYSGRAQMVHPDYVLPLERAGEIPAIEPVYPLTAGLPGRAVAKAAEEALAKLPDFPEWIEPTLLAREGWEPASLCFRHLHHPETAKDVAPENQARRRLAYDELLANQLALQLVRHHARGRKGRVLKGTGALRQQLLANFPYPLTGDQERALAEIDADMSSDDAMLRLVQGDVGSGKTIVALLAMLTAVEAGCQAALLAPTEILAKQHWETISKLTEPLGLRVGFLTGRIKGRARDTLLAAVASGDVDILIGTHALFQDPVIYRDLALVVIDEQHRFGVHQRMALTEKGVKPVDCLVLSATPIPRTLTLTLYGDMDVTRIVEKPPGRQAIDTRVVAADRLDDVAAAIGRAINEGRRVYWVCPLVEDSETSDMAAAEARYGDLQRLFGPDKVALVHGKMKAAEKDAAMTAFADGAVSILVATTVIEVGVDVPDATIMVIEQAERFGLAQLHQLRGRVGRGSLKSTCLLLRSSRISEIARQRLQVVRDSQDGFLIAEEDLRLRGGGEVLGTKQSGFPEFRIADLAVHADMLPVARDDARLVIARDADLMSERGRALRVLLYLYERDAGVRLLRSG